MLPPAIQHSHHCIDEYRKFHLNKKTLKLSFLESKIRWTYYFDPEINAKHETCYFDTNCLQGIVLFYLYKDRPNRIPLKFFE